MLLGAQQYATVEAAAALKIQDRVCAPIPKLVRIFIIPVIPNIIKI